MKTLLALFLSLGFTCAQAADSLLDRALACKLTDQELPSLIRDLAKQQAAFKKPAMQLALPSVDVYQLPAPAQALGYASADVVVMPTRILLAVKGATLAQATTALHLEEVPYSPSSRVVRPTVSLVAFKLSHEKLADKLLVGCEYANEAAALWLNSGKL